MMKNECCEACRFSTKIEAGAGTLGGFVCRRHPPTPVLVMVQAPPSVANPNGGLMPVLKAYHAPIAPDQWCGEFDSAVGVKH